MEAKLVNFSKFLKQPDTQFIIPVYQRNYDWTEKECKQLLKDIYLVGTKDDIESHFIGSIVFMHDGIYSSSGKTQLTIIDGQQRLTSISLILLALSNKLRDVDEKKANQIRKNFLINEDFEEQKIKLRPIKKDNEALRILIENDEDTKIEEYSRVIENYNYFIQEIPIDDLEIILTGLNKLVFVEISLERRKDDPQRIFESLNSTGLDLTQADLIRNYVLMDLQPEEQQKIYEKFWVTIEKYTLDNNLKQTKLSEFIRDFLTLKFRDIPTKSKVFEEFKSKFKFKNIDTLESFLQELKNLASIYQRLLNPEFEPNEIIRENLIYINRLEISVSYPFLLEVYSDYINNIIDNKTFIEILNLIQSFVWRRFVCALPTNALNKIFMRLYEEVDKKNYLVSIQMALSKKRNVQKFPTDDEFENEFKIKDFYNIQSKNRIYLLEKLENFNNNEIVQIEGNDKITIEHILPQKPAYEWKKQFGEKLHELQNKYTHTIANLTLSGNNGDLGNKPFLEKRDKPEKGYKDSRLYLNRFLSTIENWSEKEMLERQNLLTARAKLIWAYPDIDQSLFENEEQNIFDIDDATHKQILYAIFDDKKFNNIQFIELLEKVGKYLFDIEPNTFFTTDLKQKMKLTKVQSELSRPVSISPSYFIEGHGNANAILNRIKKILTAYQLYEELYIRFV